MTDSIRIDFPTSGKVDGLVGHHILVSNLINSRPYREIFIKLATTCDVATGKAYFDLGNRADNAINLLPSIAGIEPTPSSPAHAGNHPSYSAFVTETVGARVKAVYESELAAAAQRGSAAPEADALRSAGRVATAYSNGLKQLLAGGIDTGSLRARPETS